MKTSPAVASFITLIALGGAALAEGGDTSADGLQPLGSAQLASVTDQGFVVTNIGTSGEDGVEISASSAFGDGVAVDLGALLLTPGATCHVEQNGPEGVSLGSTHVLSNGDGGGSFTFDYSGLGATAVHVVEYDRLGTVSFESTFPGPIFHKPDVPNGTCPGGMSPIIVFEWWPTSYYHPDGTMLWAPTWKCPGGTRFTYERVIVVTPILPTGSPEIPGAESASVTAAGVPELSFSDDLGAFAQP